MNITDIIRRSSRSLKSAKVRTILTSLAIAVGGFTLTLTLAAGNGVRDYTNQLVKNNFDPTELIVGRDKEITNTGAPDTKPKEYDDSFASLTVGGDGSSLQIKQVTEADIAQLRALPYIEQLRENYQLSIRYITREGQKRYSATAQAYNPSQKPEIKGGQLPGSGDLGAGHITLPDNYIDVLGFKSVEDAIGKKVTVNIQQSFSGGSPEEIVKQLTAGTSISSLQPGNKDLEFTIEAVTKRAATSLNFGALPFLVTGNDAETIYDYTNKDTANYGKFAYVNVKVKDGKDQQKIKDAQADLMGKGYFTMSSKEIQKSITQIVNFLQILVGVFGLITIIASIFGVVNTQYISVLERTREIGLMKALGMRSRDVRRLFIIEAGWIGFLGGAIGAAGGIILGTLLNPWITKKLELGDTKLLAFRPLDVLLLIVALVLVAIVAGFLPARKAAKLDPIEALRTE